MQSIEWRALSYFADTENDEIDFEHFQYGNFNETLDKDTSRETPSLNVVSVFLII